MPTPKAARILYFLSDCLWRADQSTLPRLGPLVRPASYWVIYSGKDIVEVCRAVYLGSEERPSRKWRQNFHLTSPKGSE